MYKRQGIENPKEYRSLKSDCLISYKELENIDVAVSCLLGHLDDEVHAVSYTHLDVYKRQIHDSAEVDDSVLAMMATVCHAKIPLAPVVGVYSLILVAVSYTHLDVYKRQFRGCLIRFQTS